jgi:hypothetical protein
MIYNIQNVHSKTEPCSEITVTFTNGVQHIQNTDQVIRLAQMCLEQFSCHACAMSCIQFIPRTYYSQNLVDLRYELKYSLIYLYYLLLFLYRTLFRRRQEMILSKLRPYESLPKTVYKFLENLQFPTFEMIDELSDFPSPKSSECDDDV